MISKKTLTTFSAWTSFVKDLSTLNNGCELWHVQEVILCCDTMISLSQIWKQIVGVLSDNTVFSIITFMCRLSFIEDYYVESQLENISLFNQDACFKECGFSNIHPGPIDCLAGLFLVSKRPSYFFLYVIVSFIMAEER